MASSPTSVLLTRPEAENARVAEDLARAGIASICWPLMRIEFVPFDPTAGAEALVVTSANGIRAFADASPVRGLPVYCVGARTAEAVRAAGFADVFSADGDICDLAVLLRTGPARNLLYLRGEHVSADLAALLSGSEKTVESRIVYSAQPTTGVPASVREAFDEGRIGVVGIWSARAAKGLAARAAVAGLDTGRAALVAISTRALAPLADTAFADRSCASSPTADGMLEALIAAVRQKGA